MTVVGTVRTDPVVADGRFGSFTLTRLTVRRVVGRGREYATAVPVLVIGDTDWSRVRLGARVETTGRLRSGRRGGSGRRAVHRPRARVLERPGRCPGRGRAAASRPSARRSAARPTPARWCRPWWSATTADVGRGGRRLPHHRADPPRGGVRDQPHPGRRLPARARALGRGARPGPAGRRARRGGRVRGAGPPSPACCGRRDGIRSRWWGCRLVEVGCGGRPRPRRAGPGRRGAPAAARRSRGWRPRWASCCPRWPAAGILVLGPPFRDALATWLPRWAAEALAVPVRRAARLHAGGRGDLRAGQPRRGAGEPARRARRRTGHRPRSAGRLPDVGRRARRSDSAARWPAGPPRGSSRSPYAWPTCRPPRSTGRPGSSR